MWFQHGAYLEGWIFQNLSKYERRLAEIHDHHRNQGIIPIYHQTTLPPPIEVALPPIEVALPPSWV